MHAPATTIDPSKHFGLVRGIVRRALKSEYVYGEPDDLFQEGCIAVIRAARAFDPARGLKFSTLAVKYIRQAFQELHRQQHTQRRRRPPDTCRIIDDITEGSDGRHLQAEIDLRLDMQSSAARASETDRLIIELRHGQGMTWETIAQRVGIRDDHAKRRYLSAISPAYSGAA